MRCPAPPSAQTQPHCTTTLVADTQEYRSMGASANLFFCFGRISKTFYVALTIPLFSLTIACNSLFHSAVGYDQGSSVAPFTSKAVNMRADSTSDMDNG